MIDSNITDALVADSVRAQRVAALRRAGRLELVRIHVQEDENAATPDEARRTALREVLFAATTYVDTRPHLTMLIYGSPGTRYRDLTGAGMKPADAMIAANAEDVADWVVTNEKRWGPARRLLGVEVIDWAEFAQRVDQLFAAL